MFVVVGRTVTRRNQAQNGCLREVIGSVCFGVNAHGRVYLRPTLVVMCHHIDHLGMWRKRHKIGVAKVLGKFTTGTGVVYLGDDKVFFAVWRSLYNHGDSPLAHTNPRAQNLGFVVCAFAHL
jgi:hypothetical protein